MPEASRCWVCHRSVEEIAASVDTETQEERELKGQISQVSFTKSKFAESSDLWRRSLPRDFKDLDFQFIASNAGQFGSIKVLAEILDAKKLMLDWLDDAALRLRKGEEGWKGVPELVSLDESDAESVLRTVDQFEAKAHRTLQSDGPKNGYAVGFEGLKLFEGVDFLIAQGSLYYDVRAQLLSIAMAKAGAKKPKKTLRLVQANGYPPVQLCSVCETLITGLRAPERMLEPTEASPRVIPKPSKQAEKAPQPEAVSAPAMVAAAVDASENISPKVAEIINQLGPATAEAPKTRGLHEHRATEDWEALQNQSKGK